MLQATNTGKLVTQFHNKEAKMKSATTELNQFIRYADHNISTLKQIQEGREIYHAVSGTNDITHIDQNGNLVIIKTAFINNEPFTLIIEAAKSTIHWPASWWMGTEATYEQTSVYLDYMEAVYNWRDHLPASHPEAF